MSYFTVKIISCIPGILVPVGTHVDAASTMVSHNLFSKPRPHLPKFRGEKSLLSTLLGASSSTSGRFHPPNGFGLGGRLNKLLEYEPAIDMLADKLAMKIVTAQRALNQQKVGLGLQGSFSELSPVVMEKSGGKSILDMASSLNTANKDDDEPMMSESKPQPATVNPDLKDYLKGVLKGQFQEMVESSVSAEEKQPSLSSKLLNSFFRTSRFSAPQSKPMMPMMMPSGTVMLPSQAVPATPNMQQPNNNVHQQHNPIGLQGLPYPPPISQGPVGLLGTIRKLFNFGPPESAHDRYDAAVSPNFAQRTMFIGGNNTMSLSPFVDGPSPRSSRVPENMQAQSSNMIQQYALPPPSMQQPKPLNTIRSNDPTIQFTPSYNRNNNTSSTSLLSNNANVKSTTHNIMMNAHNSINSNSNINNNSNNAPPTPKPSKKKRTKSGKKPEASKWQQHSTRLIASSSTPAHTVFFTTTAKPIMLSNRGALASFHNNNITSNKNVLRKPAASNNLVVSSGDKLPLQQLKASKTGEYGGDTKIQDLPTNKRVVNVATSSSSSSNNNNSNNNVNTNSEQQSSKPAKLDMFQALLGSTRSVLNFLTKSEGRKAGTGPTLLQPRSARAAHMMDTLLRSRRSIGRSTHILDF